MLPTRKDLSLVERLDDPKIGCDSVLFFKHSPDGSLASR